VNNVQARATFGGARISKSVVAVLVGLLAAYILGGASGYAIKTLGLPTVTAAQKVDGAQLYPRHTSEDTRGDETTPRHSGHQSL
jgi:hypothetical protein